MTLNRPLSPRPSDVAGFAEAQADGTTPALPADPPATPLPAPTAHALLRVLGYSIAATVAATLVALAALPKPDGRMAPVTAAVVLLILAGGGIQIRLALVRFRSRLLEEIQAGYVTTTFQQGGFWLAKRKGSAYAPGRNVQGWDWRGLWVLDTSGGIVSSPDRSVDPPGLYPSPHSPGERELWTGHQWTNVYPDRSD